MLPIVSSSVRDRPSARPFDARWCPPAATALVAAAAIAFLASPGRAADSVPFLCATATEAQAAPPYLAVLSAFPAELAPLVAATDVDSTVEAGGRLYYTGNLDGVSVVLGLTGIGMVNAESSAEHVLATFEVAGLVVSGVAGSHHRIGDVVVPFKWAERGRPRTYRVNRALSALAQRGAAALAEPLEQCTPIPPTDPDGEVVCLPFEPAVFFDERGLSGDSFGGVAVPCTPGGGEIFGCELPAPEAAAPMTGAVTRVRIPDVEDMETAAVARVARDHRVPFLAVRAVSDGAGDPLGDRPFPAQFFDYYRLAAHNAALVARAVVAGLGDLARDQAALRTCELLAQRRWRAAARLILPP
jgi:adenosylhomocysteine nucleosidase